MRILFIGDIVGRPGVRLVQQVLPRLRVERGIDVVIANAENASNGSGCLPSDYRRLRDAGVDLVTLGDHIYKKADIISTLEVDERVCKPANFPPAAPGREYALMTTAEGQSIAAFCLIGRTFMRPVDDPFQAADRILARLVGVAKVVVVDLHAEATADKYLLLHYLKGRVAAAIGTHTHVPTADEHILDGTAFICDVGMTGPYSGILGRRADRVLRTAVTAIPTPFDVATDDVRLGGAVVDVDSVSAGAQSIQRLVVGADKFATPE